MHYTPRHLEAPARRTLEESKVLVLVGARQTGKSTMVREMFARVPERQKLFLLLDDPFLRDRLTGTEDALKRLVEEQAGRPWSAVHGFHLMLDEVQKAPALFEIVKSIYDQERDKIRWVLTGSSALAIHDPVAETLAGRAQIHHLHPFTLSEGFANARGEEADGGDPTGDEPPHGGLAARVSRLLGGRFGGEDFEALVERARWLAAERREYVEAHLRHPLFPEPSNSASPERWLADYLATYLEKDIQSLATVGNVSIFRACLRQVAARVGTPFKWETTAQEIGTTSTTLRKYVGLMEQTFNLLRLGPFAVNPVKRVIKAPKLYFRDAGLLWALRGFEDRRLLDASGMLGVYAEQLVIAELAKWCALEPTRPELRFWQKTDVSEVDLVISNRGFHIPIEIKLGRRFDRRWLRGLDAFEADHQNLRLAIPYRLLFHLGEPERPDERTFVLPIWALA